MSSESNPATSAAGAPLLVPRGGNGQQGGQTTLAALLGRAAGRRGPSMLVRETAARELEERRADWGYSKPVVAVDMIWNLVFVVVSVVMLCLNVKERPNVPLRVWIAGYAAQCFVHVVLVWVEYRRRSRRGGGAGAGGDLEAGDAVGPEFSDAEEDGGAADTGFFGTSAQGSDGDGDGDGDGEEDGGRTGIFGSSGQGSFAKRCESVNTMASFVWWIIGFYWVVSGGELLLQNSPRLYWLTVIYLAFDVFFAIFCVVLACLIGIALCCCLPCIIAILYTVAGQEGASEADLSVLPKYRFRISSIGEKPSVGAGVMVPVDTGSGYLATERVLLPEDADCCICLSSYDDGVELHALPCNHHFHATCIEKWLKMNATCPLCKYNILKGSEQV